MARRLIGVAVGVGFVILIVLAFRGCLEARKERNIRNYVQDASTIATESQQLGKNFFTLLEDPSQVSSSVEYQQKLQLLRDSSTSLLDRAHNLNVPSEMSSAQDALTQTLNLRLDALTVWAARITQATATTERADAIEAITTQMSALYASDVVYTEEAVPKVQAALNDTGVSAPPLPAGNFMPDAQIDSTSNVEWLSQDKIIAALSQVSGASDLASGTHGLALYQTAIEGTVLSPDTPNTVPPSAQEVSIQVQNQGDSDESGVAVTVTINGQVLPHGTIPAIGAGETKTVKIPLVAVPQGQEVTLDVSVAPVPGEAVSSNNESSYTVTFGS